MMEPLAETTEPEAPDTEEPDTEEQDEEEEASEEEAPAEPEPEQKAKPLTERQLKKRDKELDAEAERHKQAVELLLGDEVTETMQCPVCNPRLVGYLYDKEVFDPRDEIHARLLTVLQEPVPIKYKQDPQKRQCEVCDGWGELLTGSRRAQQEKVACATCRGSGFYPPPGSPANGTPEQPGPQPVLAVVGDGPPVDDVDPWGHPRLLVDGQPNPNYGRMPQYIDPNYP